jgi:hypothetical protein
MLTQNSSYRPPPRRMTSPGPAHPEPPRRPLTGPPTHHRTTVRLLVRSYESTRTTYFRPLPPGRTRVAPPIGFLGQAWIHQHLSSWVPVSGCVFYLSTPPPQTTNPDSSSFSSVVSRPLSFPLSRSLGRSSQSLHVLLVLRFSSGEIVLLCSLVSDLLTPLPSLPPDSTPPLAPPQSSIRLYNHIPSLSPRGSAKSSHHGSQLLRRWGCPCTILLALPPHPPPVRHPHHRTLGQPVPRLLAHRPTLLPRVDLAEYLRLLRQGPRWLQGGQRDGRSRRVGGPGIHATGCSIRESIRGISVS